MTQITTITFLNYNTFRRKVWGFSMMQFAHKQLAVADGLRFYKLMGSGKGRGFNPWPDWSVYALLQVWASEAQAERFFHTSELAQRYRDHTSEMWTIFMRFRTAHGKWDGQQPFEKGEIDPDNPLIAVITRATIRPSKLRSFWRYVPTSEKPLDDARGLIFTKGIGEVPAIQMATFSIWHNVEQLKQFAYQSAEHRGAIDRTRQLSWYKEEMFARFQPYRSEGTWGGRRMLEFI